MTRLISLALTLALTLALFATGCDKNNAAAAPKPETPADPPKMEIDVKKHYVATLDTTAGKIVLSLFANEAPKTVNNFVVLSKKGFYNGQIFHRVIPGFMIQGGDPGGTGAGGPGYRFENENRDTTRAYVTGAVGMANSGPDTNGSQFFIMDADNSLPPSQYTLFGEVKSGQDVVHKIAIAPRNGDDRPDDPTKINSITVSEE